MKKIVNQYIGRWKIIEMDMWDQDYINLVTEGHFTFSKDGSGNFQFGAVVGEINYTIEEFNKVERVEFSFEGQDENDPVSGRGRHGRRADGL